jgi:hypothetical protein
MGYLALDKVSAWADAMIAIGTIATIIAFAASACGACEEETSMSSPKRGWSQAGKLLTGVEGAVSLQANFKDPGSYTVQFGVVPPPIAAPAFGIFDCSAVVEWSVEGNTIRRRVSVGNGTSISGQGQAVAVRVSDQSSGAFGANEYTVSIQVAPGTRPSVNKPPTLRGYQTVVTVGGGATSVLDIPQDAGVISVETDVSVLVVGSLPVQALVLQVNGAGQILNQYDPTIVTGFVPVAPNATQVELVNLSANNYRLQFTFGIDG